MRTAKKRIVATALALVLAVPAAVSGTSSDAAAKKAPTLSKTKLSLFGTTKQTLKVKKNKSKLVKTTWSVNKAGKANVTLKKKKKASVVVQAKNTNGKATVTGKVKYKLAGKTKTVKLTCKVTTDTNGEDAGEEITIALSENSGSAAEFSLTTENKHDLTAEGFTANEDGSKTWYSDAAANVIKVEDPNGVTYAVDSVTQNADAQSFKVMMQQGQFRTGLTYYFTFGNGEFQTSFTFDEVSRLGVAIDTTPGTYWACTGPDGNTAIRFSFNQQVANVTAPDSETPSEWMWVDNVSKVVTVQAIAADGTATAVPVINAEYEKADYSLTLELKDALTTGSLRVSCDGFYAYELTADTAKNDLHFNIKLDDYVKKVTASEVNYFYPAVEKGQTPYAAITVKFGADFELDTDAVASQDVCEKVTVLDKDGKALKVVSMAVAADNQLIIDVEGDTAVTSDKFTVKFSPAFLAIYAPDFGVYTMTDDVVVSTKKTDI